MVKIDIELGLLKGGKPMKRLAYILPVLLLFNVFAQATPITIEISGVNGKSQIERLYFVFSLTKPNLGDIYG